MKLVTLATVESTNRYCEGLDLAQVEDFTCYRAIEQTAGIGQRGNHWHSSPGEDLTFSLVLKPTWLEAARQFRLTQAVALGIVDCLKGFTGFKGSKDLKGSKGFKDFKDLKVKWPNDIYVGGGKICGTLTSCSVGRRDAGAPRDGAPRIASAVCGIGLNVNSTTFPDWVPHPTSLSLLTGRQHDLEALLADLLACIECRYRSLQQGWEPQEEYLANLMNLGRAARYRHQGRELTATITGVDAHGRLLLTTADGESLCCGMKEIESLRV